jgi:hypothetical protein
MQRDEACSAITAWRPLSRQNAGTHMRRQLVRQLCDAGGRREPHGHGRVWALGAHGSFWVVARPQAVPVD